MAEVKISGTVRTAFGKGASRRDRRDGNVPAVIYGHGEAPKHVALPSRELLAALKTSNVLIDITYDGKTELTLPKSVSRNPLTGALAHIDLVIVRRGERVAPDREIAGREGGDAARDRLRAEARRAVVEGDPAGRIGRGDGRGQRDRLVERRGVRIRGEGRRGREAHGEVREVRGVAAEETGRAVAARGADGDVRPGPAVEMQQRRGRPGRSAAGVPEGGHRAPRRVHLFRPDRGARLRCAGGRPRGGRAPPPPPEFF